MLIAGLESVESTIAGAKLLVDICVIPTIIPLRPYDNCEMCDYPISNPADLITIETEINHYIKTIGLTYKRPHGCLSCNACIGTDLCLLHDDSNNEHVRMEEDMMDE